MVIDDTVDGNLRRYVRYCSRLNIVVVTPWYGRRILEDGGKGYCSLLGTVVVALKSRTW